MESRAHAAAAVSFLVLFAASITALTLWLTSGPPENRIYDIVTARSVGGLEPRAEVTFKGLPVGHVKEVRFAPGDPSKVLIRIGVQPGVPVTRATYAELESQPLGGVSSVSLRVAAGEPRTPLATTGLHPARLPLRAGFLQSLKRSGRRTLARIRKVVNRAAKLLGRHNTRRVAQTLARIDEASRRLVAMEQKLAPAVQRLPKVEDDLQQTLARSRHLMAEVSDLAGAARAPLRRAGRAAASVQHLGESGTVLARKLTQQTLPRLAALSEQLSRTAQRIDDLARVLRAQPRSVLTGAPEPPPGPGEPGFEPPSVDRRP